MEVQDSQTDNLELAAPAALALEPGNEGRRILMRSPFRELPAAVLDALQAIATVEHLPRRHRLSQQDEPARVFAVLGAGRVKLERMGSGHTFPVGHRGPGDVVGESGLIGALAQESAVVVNDVHALLLPIIGFRKLLGQDLLLQECVSRILLGIQRMTEDRLAALLLRSVEARLAGFLIEAEGRWGAEHEAGTVITAPFTHADIALLIGSTRETVTLQLGKLRRAGLIELDKRRVIIRDRGALARRAEAS